MKRAFQSSLILFLLLSQVIQAQPGPLNSERHEVVNPDFNHIRFYGDSIPFTTFYKKLDELFINGKGKVQVVHIGGSHIQADMWSDRVRESMQSTMPGMNGGRGFLFPFKMAKTNNPSGYIVEHTGNWEPCRNVKRDTACTLGLSGMSVTTSDSLTSLKISFRDNEKRKYHFTKVRVFFKADSSFAITFPRDSITKVEYDLSRGYAQFHFPERRDTLYMEFVKTDSLQKQFTLYGLSLDTDEPGIVYNAIGVNGASVPSYNRCAQLIPHLSAVKPDLVILSVGINDAHGADFSAEKYERDYDTLVASIRRANPDVAILFTTNNDSYYKRRVANQNAWQVREVMQKLSRKYNAGVWDMFGLMGELGSIRLWESRGLAQRDRIHFKREGYQLIGDMLFNALMKSYGEHLAKN